MTHWMEGDWPENLQPEDERDVLLKKAAKTIRNFLENELLPYTQSMDSLLEILDDLACEIESHYEDNDPRSMGWVGNDGLP